MRYLVFAWDQYYPSGGPNDLQGAFNNAEDAQRLAISCLLNFDEVAIFDMHTSNTIEPWERL